MTKTVRSVVHSWAKVLATSVTRRWMIDLSRSGHDRMNDMRSADPHIRAAHAGDADDLFRMTQLLATSATPRREPFNRALSVILADPAQRLIVAS